MCEVGLTLAEIRGLYRNVKAYSKTKRVPVSMANFPAKGYLVQGAIRRHARDVPVELSVYAGDGAARRSNCGGKLLRGKAVRLCTCNFGCHCSDCKECFPEGYVAVIEGGRQENQELLEQRF